MLEGGAYDIMNEVISCLMTRKSVRSFSGKSISKSDLEAIANAAVLAPSARNSQMWRFIVLQNKELMKKLASVIAVQTGRGDDYNFYAPDVLVIACAASDYTFAREDCACALENVFLAAHSLGIGSVWINQLSGICNVPSVRNVLNELKVPSGYSVYGMAALGYADADGERPAKKSDTIQYVL